MRTRRFSLLLATGFVVASLTGFLACGERDGESVAVPGWSSAAIDSAVSDWQRDESREHGLQLVSALFPARRVQTDGETGLPMLDVFLSDGGSRAEIRTRGLVFGVKADADGQTLWRPEGRVNLETPSQWRSDRIESLEILANARGYESRRIEVEVPPTVISVKHAAGWYWFVETTGRPILRLQQPVGRDASGREYLAQVLVNGLELGDYRELPVRQSVAFDVRFALVQAVPPIILDPTWSSTAVMITPRVGHTLTLLPSGRVLAAAGYDQHERQNSAELYDPIFAAWLPATPLANARDGQTATLRRDGRVLISGGQTNVSRSTDTTEIYDPSTDSWSAGPTLNFRRYGHTATRLDDGSVLVAGGSDHEDSSAAWNTSEVLGTGSASWTLTGPMAHRRTLHDATRLLDGTVLVSGGLDFAFGNVISSAEIFSPSSGSWTAVSPMTVGRANFSSTLLQSGDVLAVGGNDSSLTPLDSAELFDPGARTWQATATPSTARALANSTRLPSGNVMISGGGYPSPATEAFVASSGMWAAAGPAVNGPDATTVLLPSARVLSTGPTAEASLYAPAASHIGTVPMSTGRQFAASSLLLDGRVLVTGGYNNGPLSTGEIFDPGTGQWSSAASMSSLRSSHTATVLRDGRVLVVGGSNSSVGEVFDPETNTWSPTGTLIATRGGSTATLLRDGRVLVAGGSVEARAEVYDPEANTWAATGPMATARRLHGAALLRSGQVVIAGGQGMVPPFAGPLTTSEIYDPDTNAWNLTGSMLVGLESATFTPLPDGRVLAAGGIQSSGASSSYAEEFDPLIGRWIAVAPMNTARQQHTATLTVAGHVVVMGGGNSSGFVRSVEAFDPATGSWSDLALTLASRWRATAVSLPSGEILVSGGGGTSGALSGAELVDEFGGPAKTLRPVLAPETQALVAGSSMSLTGTGLEGLRSGSIGRSNDAPADVPILTMLNPDLGWYRAVGSRFSSSETTFRVPDAPAGTYILAVTATGLTGGEVVSVRNDLPAPTPFPTLPPSPTPSPTVTPTTPPTPTPSGGAGGPVLILPGVSQSSGCACQITNSAAVAPTAAALLLGLATCASAMRRRHMKRP